ncbi:MAG: hypothetical protein ACRD15_18535 [Vicinamibacterales bacterium]
MSRKITPATSLDNLRREAKRWLKALRAGDPDARARLEAAYPAAPDTPTLRDVQYALARQHQQENWIALEQALDKPGSAGQKQQWPLRTVEEYDSLAQDLVLAFDSRDDAALERINQRYGRSFTFDDLWAEIWRRVYAFRQRSSKVPKNYLLLEEAQTLIAQDTGFGSWVALTRAVATGAPPIPAYVIDRAENRIGPRRQLSDREWDGLIDAMKEQRVTGLAADGLMTDAVLARVAELDHVTALSLGGSRQLTDDGLRHLARMPQLQHLDLSEYPGGTLTDRGLEVLRHLPNLRTFSMTWQRGITDTGVANLRFCDDLERVNLMGSPTGDGAIDALQGKASLHHFSSGRLVTDAGLRLLHNIPMLKHWHGADAADAPARPVHLLIDGPFTNSGLASLAGLEGVVELDLFWHVTGITSDGLTHLADLPNVASLGADGGLTDDVAMRHIAAMPRLRRLRAQESVATDDGFEALSRSSTLESFWGRECPNFGSRAFLAFSKMPALRGLGVSCRNVDDEALSAFPHFPALRELTPIGVQDAGFRHIGRCERLERLTCMYCRDTTDAATEHIARLQVRYYYAGLTQITDRSLEILGRMTSLEQIEFYECNGITDAGLVFLAGLPRLREVALDSLPNVTLEGTRVFPAQVRVRYST